MPKFKVLRAMEGDRFYKEGETRELSHADAAQLLALGVIEPVDGAASAGKAEGAPLNKAEKAAPANKSPKAPKPPKAPKAPKKGPANG